MAASVRAAEPGHPPTAGALTVGARERSVINAGPNTLSAPVAAHHGPFCGHCGHVHPPRRVALNCRRCRGGFCTSDARYAYCTRDCRVFARRRQVRDAVRRWRASCR